MNAESPESGDYRPPPYQLATWLVLGAALVLVLGLLSIRTEHDPDSTRDYPSRTLPPDEAPTLLAWEPRDEDYFPCSDCHEDEPVNREKRELEEEHEDLRVAHGDLWCLHCHDADDRDRLQLANQDPVEFEESWRLCTQCHGKKLDDWRAGVHGKRTGSWRGEKDYRTCVVCHDPHAPPFEPIEPLPPPLRPRSDDHVEKAHAEALHAGP